MKLLVLAVASVGLSACGPKHVAELPPAADRCPTPDRIASGPMAGRWQIQLGTRGWVVCKGGRIKYRAPLGAPPPSKLAMSPTGELIGFLDPRGNTCELVVVQTADTMHDKALRFPVPDCLPAWKPHFTDDSTVTVGPSRLDPKVQIRLQRD